MSSDRDRRSPIDESDLYALVRSSQQPMLMFRLVEWQILEVSDPLAVLCAASRESMLGRPVLDFVVDHTGTRARCALMAAGELDGYHVTGRGLRRMDGSTFTVDVRVSSFGEAPPRRCAVGVLMPEGSLQLEPTTAVNRAVELEHVLQHIARQIEATGVLEGMWEPPGPRMPTLSGLSARQLEIVRRLLIGDRVPMIARQLFLSESTVRNHLTAVYRKLGVRSQQQLLSLLRAERLR